MKYILLILLLLFSLGCTQQKEKELTIATNAWIGYTPLFYAKEKGYLKKLHIRLIHTVSLGEASDIFEVGGSDMVTTTQHEYNSLKHSNPSIIPIILLDRSDGGDMILSNRTIQELQKETTVYVYLEIDSINAEMIEAFTAKYKLNPKSLIYINKDQAKIQDIIQIVNKAILIVSYSPYDIELKKRGFKTVASTKDIDSIMVIDAICTTDETAKLYKKRLKSLKKVIDLSISELMADTNKSHSLVAKYLSNISYKEYVSSLESIKWINKPSKELLEHITVLHYDEKELIQ